jgi:hypothetical protein
MLACEVPTEPLIKNRRIYCYSAEVRIHGEFRAYRLAERRRFLQANRSKRTLSARRTAATILQVCPHRRAGIGAGRSSLEETTCRTRVRRVNIAAAERWRTKRSPVTRHRTGQLAANRVRTSVSTGAHI